MATTRLEPCPGSLSWLSRHGTTTTQRPPTTLGPTTLEPDVPVGAAVDDDDTPWDDDAWLLYLQMDFYSEAYFPAFPDLHWEDEPEDDDDQ